MVLFSIRLGTFFSSNIFCINFVVSASRQVPPYSFAIPSTLVSKLFHCCHCLYMKKLSARWILPLSTPHKEPCYWHFAPIAYVGKNELWMKHALIIIYPNLKTSSGSGQPNMNTFQKGKIWDVKCIFLVNYLPKWRTIHIW